MNYALVLGASGDIGRACAMSLAAEGWSLYCHYYQNQESNLQLVKSLQEAYPEQDFFSVSMDMRDETQVPQLMSQLFQVDGVVFASGRTIYQLLTETSSADMEELWQVFVKIPMLICQALQSKLARGQGRIVFIGSVYGSSGSPMEVVYSTLKGAQQAFANAYAQEVASLGIRVNVVAPGAVDTQMNRHWAAEEREALLAKIPLQRMADPLEVAGVVNFLFSQKGAYITGSTIPISGGWKV